MPRWRKLNGFSLLRMLLLSAACLFSFTVLADDAARIIDSPVAVPEALLKKMDTLRLRPDAGSGVVRYMANNDSELLREWLRSAGYLDAEVIPEYVEGQARWQVKAGALWRIRHVEILPAPRRKIDLFKANEAFRSDSYESAKARLLWSWRDAGYLRAQFTSAVVTPDHQNQQVDVVWQVELGPLFYISELRIEGARQYDADLARKLSRLKAGQVPTQKRLQDAMQRIAADSRYQHAIIVPELEQAEGDQVPVRITLTEAAWRKLTGDAGYSTDAGIGLGLGWVDRSLLGGQIEYSLRGEISNTNSGAGATLLRPVWPDADQQVGISADYNHVNSDGRRYDAVSGGPFWQWYFSRDDYLRLTLHAEQVREAGLRLLTVGPRADIHFQHTRGNKLPVRGWKLDVGLDLPVRMGSPGLWPVFTAAGRLYQQPLDWLLLSPRLGYGRTLNLQGTVPKTYRQFAGGATSVRGYALDSLGPIGIDGLATGGLMKTYGGLDLVLMPNAELFSPVLFGDVAKVWQAIGTTAPVVWSAGIGAIVHTPAGPLRLDLAFPLKRKPQDARFQFYITLGDVL